MVFLGQPYDFSLTRAGNNCGCRGAERALGPQDHNESSYLLGGKLFHLHPTVLLSTDTLDLKYLPDSGEWVGATHTPPPGRESGLALRQAAYPCV